MCAICVRNKDGENFRTNSTEDIFSMEKVRIPWYGVIVRGKGNCKD